MVFKKIRNNQDKEKPGFAGRINVDRIMIKCLYNILVSMLFDR